MENKSLNDDIRLAQNARKKACVDLEDDYTVGCVIKSKSGRKYTGCNINVKSSEVIYAEKAALMKAISEGEKEFEYIFIISGKKDKNLEKYLPNKECIEFMKKFVDDDFKIYNLYSNKIEEYDLSKI